MSIRKDNFKICTFHGIIDPEKGSKEAKLRNALYLIGNLNLQISRTEAVSIRIIGYEIPIENRGKRIDLIGYDKDKNPWIIELKAHDSTEKIKEVIQQINGYEIIFKNQIDAIEKEFADKCFLNISLTRNIKKMILAPRDFYENQDTKTYPKMDEIVVCSIARIKEIFDSSDNFILGSKLGNYETINLKVENK